MIVIIYDDRMRVFIFVGSIPCFAKGETVYQAASKSTASCMKEVPVLVPGGSIDVEQEVEL